MATKTFNVPSNCTQVNSNFTLSGNYYQGTALFRPSNGWEFVTPTLSGTNYANYNILVTRANGTTFNIKSTNYCTFTKQGNGDLLFTLKTAAQIGSESFALSWTFEPTLQQTARELTIIENLQNCVLSGLPSVVTDVSTLNLTLTANTDYVFNTVPSLDFDNIVVNPDGNPARSEDFTVSQDGLTATLQIDLSEYQLDYIAAVETITITATAETTLHAVEITRSLQYCTTNAPTYVTENDTEINIICTPSNGYQFDTAPTIIFYDSNNVVLHSFTFTVLTSKLSANVTFDVSQMIDFADVETIILTAAAAQIPQPVDTVSVITNIQNAVLNGVPQTVYVNSVLNLIATVNSGYKFNAAEIPQIYIIDANGNPQIINFVLSENDTVAQCTANLAAYDLDSTSSVEITAIATAITPYVEKYGTVNVYKVDESILAQFAAVRFKVERDSASDTSGYFQLVDLGDYVVSVKRFYCPISDTLNAVIKAGNYNTGIVAETPENDNILIDCGTVVIPSYNHSITDYENTEIKVFLPFVGYVALPSEYVGKTISLQYAVNIVKGDCIAKIVCEGVVIDFVECTITNDIVYKTTKSDKFDGNADFNMQILKGLQPYIVIKYHSDENNFVNNSDCVRTPLINISGYCELTEIENFSNSMITDTEKEKLFAILHSGVYF